MSDELLEVLITAPALLAAAWGYLRVMPMRYASLFVVLYVGVTTFFDAVGERFFGPFEGVVILFVVEYVVPFVLYRGTVALRALVVVVGSIFGNAAHFVSFAAWSLLMGAPVPDGVDAFYDAVRAYPLPFFVSECVRIALVLMLFYMLSALVSKRSVDAPRHLGVFALFLLAQVVLLLELLVVQALSALSVDLNVGVALLLMGCLLADGILYVDMRNFEREQREAVRASLLERQLEEELAAYGAVAEEIERTARIRHDVRNHLQVVATLAESGEVERAQQQVAALRRALAEGAEGGERPC